MANPSSQTLKLSGELKGIPIQMLVDSSASHNFISRKLLSKLDLPTQSFSSIYIQSGDGHQIWVQQKCERVSINFGEFSSQLTALVFYLGDLDLVLAN